MLKEEFINIPEGQCKNHRVGHSFRVMKLDRIIFNLELASAPEEVRKNPDFFVEVLDWAAMLHDREMLETGKYDFEHGEKAALRVDEIVGEMVSFEEREMVKFLCKFHVPDDNEIIGITETQRWLLSVFKDADGLDRVRFDNGNKSDEKYRLDLGFLRFESSKTLIDEARKLWEETKDIVDPKEVFDAVFGNRVE